MVRYELLVYDGMVRGVVAHRARETAAIETILPTRLIVCTGEWARVFHSHQREHSNRDGNGACLQGLARPQRPGIVQ